MDFVLFFIAQNRQKERKYVKFSEMMNSEMEYFLFHLSVKDDGVFFPNIEIVDNFLLF